MKRIDIIVSGSGIYRNSDFKTYRKMLQAREQEARQILNDHKEIKHIIYGYRYEVEGVIDCYISGLMIEDDKTLDMYIDRAAKLDNAILYTLHQR